MLPLAVCGNKAEDSCGGGGGGGDKAAANWPQRGLRIMAPADPGGGWDTTARAMSKALADDKIIKKASEVYNVPGAGGTIGLSQLAISGSATEVTIMYVIGVLGFFMRRFDFCGPGDPGGDPRSADGGAVPSHALVSDNDFGAFLERPFAVVLLVLAVLALVLPATISRVNSVRGLGGED